MSKANPQVFQFFPCWNLFWFILGLTSLPKQAQFTPFVEYFMHAKLPFYLKLKDLLFSIRLKGGTLCQDIFRSGFQARAPSLSQHANVLGLNGVHLPPPVEPLYKSEYEPDSLSNSEIQKVPTIQPCSKDTKCRQFISAFNSNWSNSTKSC